MKVLVTGVAGFIGMYTARRLLERGDEVIGIDNLNDYYDPGLKRARLKLLTAFERFRFVELDVGLTQPIAEFFVEHKFDKVIHLAAQAGVRYSLVNPQAYAHSNLVGFVNILEGCRRHDVGHLVYASSSSVYGGNVKTPFDESDPVNHPVSLYAATKKSNELMAHAYSHLYGLPTTGLRFFTVYGPWGRPDMAPYLFTDAIAHGRPIDVFNNGNMRRDFTYIDDVVTGVVAATDRAAKADETFDTLHPNPAASTAPYRIFNIGNSQPVELGRFIAAVESALGRTAVKRMLPMQPGDVQATHATTDRLESWVGFHPETPLETGIGLFVQWYLDYHRLDKTKLPMKA
jgi:UDP-glucuronate 4-epimerase